MSEDEPDDPFELFDAVAQSMTAQTQAALSHGRAKFEKNVASDTLPEQFSRNTEKALGVQHAIMSLPLDRNCPQYGVELRAVAAVSNNQISAQLRADEAVVKEQQNDDRLNRLLEILNEEKAKMRDGQQREFGLLNDASSQDGAP